MRIPRLPAVACVLLLALAAGGEELQLQQVVLLSRHGVGSRAAIVAEAERVLAIARIAQVLAPAQHIGSCISGC